MGLVDHRSNLPALRPMASESDASAFTEIKIQSVVLQFLIDNAYDIFSDNVSINC